MFKTFHTYDSQKRKFVTILMHTNYNAVKTSYDGYFIKGVVIVLKYMVEILPSQLS